MKNKRIIYGIAVFFVLFILLGCGGGGEDDFGVTSTVGGDVTVTSDVSAKLANAKSYINSGTTSDYTNALTILQDLESNPTYSPLPEEKLEIKTGIVYCNIRLGTTPVESYTASSQLESIIQNSGGVTIPQDTYFLLASSYFAQKRENDAISVIKEMGKVNGIFNPNFTYSSEFNIATDGDAHAFMALLYLLNNDETDAKIQKDLAVARGVSTLGSNYLSEITNLGL